MNLAAVASLPLKGETRTWYRAVDPRFLPSALATAHTTRVFTRYSPGPLGMPPFEILYLAENQLVSMFEVGALYGKVLSPGGVVANPKRTWVVVNVAVQLQAIADIAQATAQQALRTTAQELTGDWEGYQTRSPTTSVPQPVGIAPTQMLGEALFQDPRQIEGFLSLSARIPYHLSLMVFPTKLRPGSFIAFEWEDPPGVRHTQRIP